MPWPMLLPIPSDNAVKTGCHGLYCEASLRSSVVEWDQIYTLPRAILR